MTDQRSDHDDHDDHDAYLIAAHVADDLSGPERTEASRLVADCRACADLLTDLRAIAVATRDLPAPARQRDFTLSPDDAARLGRRGWRGFLAGFAGPRFSVARPVGAAFMTLGLVGLLLAALPGAMPLAASPGSAAREDGSAHQPAAPPTEAEPLVGDTSVDQQGDRLDGTASGAPAGAGQGAAPGGAPTAETQGGESDTAAEPGAAAEVSQRPSDMTLAVLSGSFLIVGIGLLGLRWTARRLGGG